MVYTKDSWKKGADRLKRSQIQKTFPLLALGVFAAVAVFWGCPIRHLTGIPCPGCGLTRACLSAIAMKWQEAFFFHPLWPLALLVLLTALFFPKNTEKRQRFCRIAAMGAIGAFLIVYLVRMLIFFPDTAPMEFYSDALIPKIISNLF